MFKIEYGKIFITRGDSAAFDIEVRQPDKRTVYELAAGDTLTFTVKPSDSEVEHLLQKTGKTIQIAPADTQKWAYGKYWYDVQLTFADGTINTIVPPTPFIVCSEITFGQEVLGEDGKPVPSTACNRKHGVHSFGSGAKQLIVDNKQKSVTVTLTVANWSSSNTQTVTVNGVTASNMVFIAPAPASFLAYCDAQVRATTQAANSLTFTCESKPEAALTVNIGIFG